MKIVFCEVNNEVIREAIENYPEIQIVKAADINDACRKLASDEAEAMIAGIDIATREVVLAAKDVVKLVGDFFSSSFLMEKNGKKILVADGGVNKNPSAEQLEKIVLQTYETAKKVLDEEPKIAMLSFSTFGSGGNDENITKIHQVIDAVHKKYPDILIDGEMQLDTAIDGKVAKKKANGSLVAGEANILVCPDLNSGNILYKSMERFGGWTAAGPILQGFAKPISDLSRGSTTEDVILAIKTLERIIK